MRRLLKICLIIIGFWLFSPAPVRAQSCYAPRPENPMIDTWIQQARARGGAAALVPAKVLKAIYYIEATTAYANPSAYSCQATTPNSSALGLMQILDKTYEEVVAPNERMDDAGVCQPTNCKLSRCNPVDAMEIAARVLLYKAGVWDTNKYRATGEIKTKEAAYTASCLYYAASQLGPYEPDDLTNAITPRVGANPKDPENKQSYCEFVVVKAGLYSPFELPWPRTGQGGGSHGGIDWKFDACTIQNITPITLQFDFHPLRPFPDDPAAGTNEDYLSPFCALRPMAVQVNRYDRREEFIDLMAIGNLEMNFENFITPLLSITDPKKPDYTLPYTDKAQRYLADFLEGRAYYEPQAEIAPTTQTQQADLFNRLGVFRKLAPQSYQDELKVAIIDRANNRFAENPYGFEPASTIIHNYVVGYWDGFQVVDQKQGEEVTLSDFFNHKKPLVKDFDQDHDAYTDAYEAWENSDSGKWYQLWDYVPMFTREDSTGYIEVYDSNFPPYPEPYSPSGGKPLEKNKTSGKKYDVNHPHLARTYEVATSLSYMLSPQEVHEATPAAMYTEWTFKAWEDSDWWMDPSLTKIKSYQLNYSPMSPYTQEPGAPKLELGPLCEVDPNYVTPITSSGDLAHDSIFNTDVNRQDQHVTNDTHDYQGPPSKSTLCGLLYPCEECVESIDCSYNPTYSCNTVYTIDDSACFYEKGTPADPNYLVTYTPFLDQILVSTINSPRAIFDIFKPYTTEEKEAWEEYDWPGLGNSGEESPVYEFSGGGVRSYARAGTYKPADSQSYYYRYLGSIQCAKERVMMVLQPFITGEQYKPYASACFPELASSTTTPTGERWLQWPTHNVHTIFQCFRDTRTGNTHAGIDIDEIPSDGPIYPAATGKVIDVGFDAEVFGHYVIIQHDPPHQDYSTIYAHLKPNIQVHQGQQITNLDKPLGFQDDSGAASRGDHLHFGLTKGTAMTDFYYQNTPIEDPCAQMVDCECPTTGN